MVTGHLFTMSFDYIKAGIRPHLGNTFSGRGSSQKAALQAYCQHDFAACLQMVGDVPSTSPSSAHSQTTQQPLRSPQSWSRTSPWAHPTGEGPRAVLGYIVQDR